MANTEELNRIYKELVNYIDNNEISIISEEAYENLSTAEDNLLNAINILEKK